MAASFSYADLALEIARVRRLVEIAEERAARTEQIVYEAREIHGFHKERADQAESDLAAERAKPPKEVEKIVEVEKEIRVPVDRVVEVERIVERVVEKPVHVVAWQERPPESTASALTARIARLERELADANDRPLPPPVEIERIVEKPVEVVKEVVRTVDRIVEKEIPVEDPALRARADELERQLAEALSRPLPEPVTREVVVEKHVEKVVEVRVEVPVPVEDHELRARADRLEAELTAALERPDPPPLLVDRPVEVVREVLVEKPVEVIREIRVPVEVRVPVPGIVRVADSFCDPTPPPTSEDLVTLVVHEADPESTQDSVAAPRIRRQDPVHKVAGGYRWGKTGKVYRTKGKAQKQAAAIYASGYRDDAGRPLSKFKLHQLLGPPKQAEARFRLDLVQAFRAVHHEVESRVFAKLNTPEPEHRVSRDTRYRTDASKKPPKGGKTQEKEQAGKRTTSKTQMGAAAGVLDASLLSEIDNHMRTVGTVAFDRMADAVHKKTGEAVKAIIPITPKSAGLEDLIDDARNDALDYLVKAGREYTDDVRDVLEDEDNFGLPVKELSKLIQQRAGVSISKSELLAADQTTKLNAGIMRARHLAAGIERATWSSSNDERVRESHQILDGQVYSIEEGISEDQAEESGEEPGAVPGSPVRCRCVAVPYLEEPEEEEEGEEAEEPDESEEEGAEA
jgi:SPP1 gp7 family putative phage head morphogenesis protein